jgi:peptidoglycan/xylan/chitin deacetylase (PgdA/CDA1 family)
MARKLLARVLARKLMLTSGPPSSQAVCLTFDDGPHPEHTPQLLDVLAAEQVAATFFVLGERAAENPDLVRRIVSEGHGLGHHSYHHGDPRTTSASALIAEVDETLRLLETLVGARPRLFRPPHGKVTAAKLARLFWRGQTVVLWNVDPRDFDAADAASVTARLSERPPSAGDIVLLHDNHPLAARVLPALAADVRARGLRFGRVSEWTA